MRSIPNRGLIAAGAIRAEAAPDADPKIPDPEVYTRIGVRPFINCTATCTINGGSQLLPEVISTIAQASYHHVNLDELMEKVGGRLAELLQVGWGIVTAGAAAALTHATAGCLAGTDPEKIQRLPNLDGLKNEVISRVNPATRMITPSVRWASESSRSIHARSYAGRSARTRP